MLYTVNNCPICGIVGWHCSITSFLLALQKLIHTVVSYTSRFLREKSATNHNWLYISEDELIHLLFRSNFGMTLHFDGENDTEWNLNMKLWLNGSDSVCESWVCVRVIEELPSAGLKQKGTNPSLLGSAALRVSVSIVKLQRDTLGSFSRACDDSEHATAES